MKTHTAFWLFFLLFGITTTVQGREITDMSGRKVTIPDTITKVFAVSPPGTYLLYAIDPHVICGLNFPLWENEKKYTIPDYGKLPVIGGMVGQSRTLNREVLLQIQPDFLLYWAWKDDAATKKFEQAVAELHFPLVSVRLDSIKDYPAALRFLGDAIGRPERGELLGRYADAALQEARTLAAGIPEEKRVKVYYAEGPDGLSTERATSLHAELIPLAGGYNVHRGDEIDHYGMEKISMEQLMLYDPDVIMIKEKSFFDTVFSDSRWQYLRAVRGKRVYLIPFTPFNWFDRPPSFMRLLGIKWLIHTLHPEHTGIDMMAETKKFYRLFLGMELDDRTAGEILNP